MLQYCNPAGIWCNLSYIKVQGSFCHHSDWSGKKLNHLQLLKISGHSGWHINFILGFLYYIEMIHPLSSLILLLFSLSKYQMFSLPLLTWWYECSIKSPLFSCLFSFRNYLRNINWPIRFQHYTLWNYILISWDRNFTIILCCNGIYFWQKIETLERSPQAIDEVRFFMIIDEVRPFWTE